MELAWFSGHRGLAKRQAVPSFRDCQWGELSSPFSDPLPTLLGTGNGAGAGSSLDLVDFFSYRYIFQVSRFTGDEEGYGPNAGLARP